MPREKPDHLGLCHRDGCGEFAKWKARLIFRDTEPLIKGRVTVWVCDAHKPDAEAYILNDENRDRLVEHLVDNNFCDRDTAVFMVRHNLLVEFFDPFAEAA